MLLKLTCTHTCLKWLNSGDDEKKIYTHNKHTLTESTIHLFGICARWNFAHFEWKIVNIDLLPGIYAHALLNYTMNCMTQTHAHTKLVTIKGDESKGEERARNSKKNVLIAEFNQNKSNANRVTRFFSSSLTLAKQLSA